MCYNFIRSIGMKNLRIKIDAMQWLVTVMRNSEGSVLLRIKSVELWILHSAAEPQDEVEGALLLDVVVGESAPVLQLLPGEDQPLLIRRNPLLVLDLCLDVLDGVGRLHLEGDSLAGEGLDEYLHPAAEPQDEVEGALLLDVVIGEGSSVLQLLPREDEPLLVRGNTLLVLNLCFNVLDGVGRLHLEGDGLAGEGLDEDLHPAAEPQDKVEGALLLDVVVGEGSPILKLFSSEDKPLLVRRNPLLILDLGFHVLDGVGRLHLKSDGLAGQSFNEDLHGFAIR